MSDVLAIIYFLVFADKAGAKVGIGGQIDIFVKKRTGRRQQG
jgi:hypothetical protein